MKIISKKRQGSERNSILDAPEAKVLGGNGWKPSFLDMSLDGFIF